MNAEPIEKPDANIDNTLVGGVPARIIKTIEECEWFLYSKHYGITALL